MFSDWIYSFNLLISCFIYSSYFLTYILLILMFLFWRSSCYFADLLKSVLLQPARTNFSSKRRSNAPRCPFSRTAARQIHQRFQLSLGSGDTSVSAPPSSGSFTLPPVSVTPPSSCPARVWTSGCHGDVPWTLRLVCCGHNWSNPVFNFVSLMTMEIMVPTRPDCLLIFHIKLYFTSLELNTNFK